MDMAEARNQLLTARRVMRRMKYEFSGCDWCCGGGDEAYGYEAERVAEALKVLGDEATPIICSVCDYYDAIEGVATCEKCSLTVE